MEFFLIIKCGFEGIEKIIYPTNNSDDAIKKLIKIREDIESARIHRQEFLKENGTEEDENFDDAWDRLYYDNKISREEFENSKFNDPEAYCIHKWNGEDFVCVCTELGFSNEKKWFY